MRLLPVLILGLSACGGGGTSGSNSAAPTADTWTWVSGTLGTNPTAGTMQPIQGVPSTTIFPSARDSAAAWTDAAGNLWLFGGELNVGQYAPVYAGDLWRYSPADNSWTWVAGGGGSPFAGGVYGSLGVPSASNFPGARAGATTWTDAAGNFWMFGGVGFGGSDQELAQPLNDLWEYRPGVNTWVWVSGSNVANAIGTYKGLGTASASNVPGARSGASAWRDADGNLWLFGGQGYDSAGSIGALNDLWFYSPSAATWTWMGGSNLSGAAGAYGTQGAASTTSAPGARSGSVVWADASGNFWLFGGVGFGAAGSDGVLNDLWVYAPSANTWTWLGGSDQPNAPGTYGTQGQPSTANLPGARQGAVAWIDAVGNLWLFGGSGLDSAGSSGVLNDLWVYAPSAKTWTWIDGSSVGGSTGFAGAQGTSSPAFTPAARMGANSWVDPAGKLWLFGGTCGCVPSNGDTTHAAVSDGFHDLWAFTP